jgi:hypothetical protein
MMMVPELGWEEDHFQRLRDKEALLNVCLSVLDRTIRDLFTYRDRRNKKRARLYDTAYNWVFQHDDRDTEVPMSFTYVCGILDFDADTLAKSVWTHRHLTYKEIKAEMKRQERVRRDRGLQRGREEDDSPGDCTGHPNFPL